MADEQNTQTTQATEQTAALSGGGDPNTSTPENSVQAEKTFTQSEVNALITARSARSQASPSTSGTTTPPTSR